jgi:hypothetical protein
MDKLKDMASKATSGGSSSSKSATGGGSGAPGTDYGDKGTTEIFTLTTFPILI